MLARALLASALLPILGASAGFLHLYDVCAVNANCISGCCLGSYCVVHSRCTASYTYIAGAVVGGLFCIGVGIFFFVWCCVYHAGQRQTVVHPIVTSASISPQTTTITTTASPVQPGTAVITSGANAPPGYYPNPAFQQQQQQQGATVNNVNMVNYGGTPSYGGPVVVGYPAVYGPMYPYGGGYYPPVGGYVGEGAPPQYANPPGAVDGQVGGNTDSGGGGGGYSGGGDAGGGGGDSGGGGGGGD